jgi:hypothetical protein
MPNGYGTARGNNQKQSKGEDNFRSGGGAETWLRLQMAYDLAQARRHEGDINVKPVARRKLHEPRP